MHPYDFEKQISSGRDQVLVMMCPASIPFSFALHPWFVVSRGGTLTRWEVIFRQTQCEISWGHLHKDLLPPFQGIEVIPFFAGIHWRGRVLARIVGTPARQLADAVEASSDAYPHRYSYSFTGPNSGTYVQWALDQVPGLGVILPGRMIGKGYRSGASRRDSREV